MLGEAERVPVHRLMVARLVVDADGRPHHLLGLALGALLLRVNDREQPLLLLGGGMVVGWC